MTSTDWDAALRGLRGRELLDVLTAHSGLPGPRANLSLLHAVVRAADPALITHLESTGDEYAVMCAAASRGARADDPGNRERLRSLAADDRWRVREEVAIGLQLLGDRDIASLMRIAREWAGAADPLLQRAAVVALCEPRLLREPGAVSAAVEICSAATAQFVGWSDRRRRSPGARTLRQALGYCWSVVVAASPDVVLETFLGLDTDDPDIAWIVATNLQKTRLSRIVQSRS